MSSTPTIRFQNENVKYSETSIMSEYEYCTTKVSKSEDGSFVCNDVKQKISIKTDSKIGKTGVLMAGIGGNNGTTLAGGIIANRTALTWSADRKGEKNANWYGSMLESGTMRLGTDAESGKDIFVPLKSVVPLTNASDIVLDGWDIHHSTMAESMARSKVLPVDLQRQLKEDLENWVPMKGVFRESWIAQNQSERADWVKTGTLSSMLSELRDDIRTFKAKHSLDKVIVFWSGNTERFSQHLTGVHDTASNFLAAVEQQHSEIAPSALYCLAAIQEGCTFINGSPQNTFCTALIELAQMHKTFLAGDDLKTGQTKIKSVLADWLISSGLKLRSIASYNHLGNNDGLNLREDAQFRSKEVSKSDVVTDVVRSNDLLYKENEEIDHVVVIKYVPYVGDSKRAMDEYTSEMFMGGDNTIVLHNTCEDSLLAAPLMMDLILLAEFCERVTIKSSEEEDYTKMYPILSLLSLFLKAPASLPGSSVVNAFFQQRSALTNFFRAVVGLSPDNNMRLEERFCVPTLSEHILQ